MSCLQAIEGEDIETLSFAISWTSSAHWATKALVSASVDPWSWHRPTDNCSLRRFEATRKLLYPTWGLNQVGYIYTSIYGRDLYLSKPKLGPPKQIPAPDKNLGGCNNPTSNWSYQSHNVPYLVMRTTDYLTALWPDSDHWTHAPGVYSVATNSWWILHSWLTGDPIWGDSRGLPNRVSEKSWILLSDLKGLISSTIPYLNQSPTEEILNLN